MIKALISTTIILCSRILFAQEASNITADQILASSIEFAGGENRISLLKTAEIDYSLVQPDSSTAIMHLKIDVGQKFVQSILSETHTPQSIFFEGKRLSTVSGSSVTHHTASSKMEEVWLKTYPHIQYGYKKNGYKLIRLPDQKFEHFDCYVVTAEANSGYITTNFFDKTNYRLLMIAYPNGDKSLLIDYEFEDGILFDSRIINTFSNSKETQELIMFHADLNDKISNVWFTCPYKDKVVVPNDIRVGKFESTNGPRTMFMRDDKVQEYWDENGNLELRRFLAWGGEDYYGLIDEAAIKNNDRSPESEILVRIISWDKKGYVVHWIAGKYTDTQDYRRMK